MKLYSYIITRDYGFAPNPFFSVCTLANCKPKIRLSAQVGDVIAGIGSAREGSAYKNRLVYAMVVSEKITYDDYWNAEAFSCKKPTMHGSLKKKYGDNIYHISEETGKFIQEDSHHSFENGVTNYLNYERDLSGKYVLIGYEFWYFGISAIELPPPFMPLAEIGIGHKVFPENIAQDFLRWLRSLDESGYIDSPIMFCSSFERYNGK